MSRMVPGLIGACLLMCLPSSGLAQEARVEGGVTGKLLLSFEGPDRSTDGLELSRFSISALHAPLTTGRWVLVGFTLKNVTTAPIRLGPLGAAATVRIVSGGSEQNRSLDPQNANAVIEPRGVIRYTKGFVVDAVGTWYFAPLYDVGGHSAPARWHELSVEVAEAPRLSPEQVRQADLAWRRAHRRETQLGHCGDPGTLPHGLAVDIEVRGTDPPRVGDKLEIKWRYQNLYTDRPVLFGRKGIFVTARHLPHGQGNRERRDFGQQFPYAVLRTYSPTRTIEGAASLTVDGAGTWLIWPSFEVDGEEAPERWCAISVEVEE